MKIRILSFALFTALLALIGCQAMADPIKLTRDLKYTQGDGFVDVTRGDQLIARYVYKDTPKPYIYPLNGPGGEALTRAYPMKEVAGEPTDHPHHRSFWVGHGDVNGVDFWAEGEKSGRIVQTTIDFNSEIPGHWNISTNNVWVGPDEKTICTEARRYSFVSCDYGILVSTSITLAARGGDVKFGGTKEGFFALRLAPGLQLAGGKGHILNSEKLKDQACWGKRARWRDYTGEVDGKTCGVTVFDLPSNQGHPTYWHARDYGLLAANPFGGKDFTGDPKTDSGFTLGDGRTLRLVYITLLHSGKLEAEKIDALADQILGKAPPKREPTAPTAPAAPAAPAAPGFIGPPPEGKG